MSVLATDILIKTMLEAAIDDLRANQWLLDDVFSGLVTDPLSKDQYGYKMVKAAKDWFISNDIKVYSAFRIDTPTFPCLTIAPAPADEATDRASLADEGSIEDFDPQGTELQPQVVYPSFTPAAYNRATGMVTFPSGTTTDYIVPGQFLVSRRSGKAYQILQCLSTVDFTIKADVKDDFTDAYIVPPTALWNLHREQTFIRESYSIGCHAQSDPVQATWLRQIVLYSLCRYKEAFLEARGFELSTFRAGPMDKNPYFEAEQVYSSVVNLSGTVELSWIKFVAPKLQSAQQGIRIIDGPKTPPGYEEMAKNQGWHMEGDDFSTGEDPDGDC